MNYSFDPKEKDIIRRLAGELAEIGSSAEQQEKIRAWTALNDLKPERPMVWITEIPWKEVENKIDELRPQCQDETLLGIERKLRRQLFTARHLECDEVIYPRFDAGLALENWGYGVEIEEDQIAQGDSHVQSHHFKPVIQDFEDIEKIRMPEVHHNQAESERRLAFHRELFGDILSVELTGPRRQFFNGWDNVVRWTGVTEALMDLAVRPDYVHALMRRLTDSMLSRLEQFERQGLLGYPHPVQRVGSGAAGFTDELPAPDADPEHIRTMDQWGGATAQIFGEVSPEMHEEFALQYENEVMSRCGLNYYGCCEPLHGKMHLMAKVPRLRKISISPWCDVAKAVANADKKYVFSHKPNPAIMAEDKFNLERAEEDMRQRLRQSEDMPCEFVLKDISTICGDIERLISWCRMASRVAREG